MDDHRRTLRRILGWGGALIFSLFAWAAVFWLVGAIGAHESRCGAIGPNEAASSECVAAGRW